MAAPTFPDSIIKLISQSSSQAKDQRALIVQLGEGKQTRMGLGKSPNFDRWNLEFEALTYSQFTILNNFYKTVGIILPFSAQLPDRPWRYYIFDGGLSYTDNGVPAPNTRYNVSCLLLQVDYSEL